MTERPAAGEYPSYFETYISKVPENDVLEVLARQGAEIAAIFDKVPAGAGGYRYGEGKWTLLQLLCHIVDTERIMAYRALCFARGEQTNLPSFDENLYAANADVSARTVADLLEELRLARAANLHFFRHLTAADWLRQGVANHNATSVRAIAFVMAGHLRHHLRIIEERYLPGLG